MRFFFRLMFWGGLFLVVMVILGFLSLFLYGWMENRHYENLTDTKDLGKRADEMAAPYIADRKDVRLAIGITQRGKRFYKEYSSSPSVTPSRDSAKPIYEIGSITKVFTGILLAKLEGEGSVTLDQSIGTLLPEDAHVSGPVAQLTLKQLATHTSALPRLPGNLEAASDNPYATYAAKQLYEDLQVVQLTGDPGTKSAYSNYGVGLLGHLLALKSGKTYDELVQEKICQPLGMTSTWGRSNDELRKRFVTGHSPGGEKNQGWDFDVLEGAGGLHADVADMLTFIEQNIHPANDELGKALKRAQEVHFADWLNSVGLGWQISDDPYIKKRIHWHNGGTGGFVSYLGMIASEDVGVVILSNYGDAFAGDSSVDKMGVRLLRYATKISLE